MPRHLVSHLVIINNNNRHHHRLLLLLLDRYRLPLLLDLLHVIVCYFDRIIFFSLSRCVKQNETDHAPSHFLSEIGKLNLGAIRTALSSAANNSGKNDRYFFQLLSTKRNQHEQRHWVRCWQLVHQMANHRYTSSSMQHLPPMPAMTWQLRRSLLS